MCIPSALGRCWQLIFGLGPASLLKNESMSCRTNKPVGRGRDNTGRKQEGLRKYNKGLLLACLSLPRILNNNNNNNMWCGEAAAAVWLTSKSRYGTRRPWKKWWVIVGRFSYCANSPFPFFFCSFNSARRGKNICHLLIFFANKIVSRSKFWTAQSGLVNPAHFEGNNISFSFCGARLVDGIETDFSSSSFLFQSNHCLLDSRSAFLKDGLWKSEQRPNSVCRLLRGYWIRSINIKYTEPTGLRAENEIPFLMLLAPSPPV